MQAQKNKNNIKVQKVDNEENKMTESENIRLNLLISGHTPLKKDVMLGISQLIEAEQKKQDELVRLGYKNKFI